MKKKGKIHVGTSGWHYLHWKNRFYPSGMPADRFLAFYAGQFQTTEINNTFYQLPRPEAIQSWLATVPDQFIFSVKASRYITHQKKLKDPQKSLALFFDRIRQFGKKLEVILFQLPGHWKPDAQRLNDFLQILDKKRRYAFEFRNPDWQTSVIIKILQAAGCAFCIYEFNGVKTPDIVTADFVYIRLHGPRRAYQGSYDTCAIQEWAGKIVSWSRQGKDVYIYFDNDEKAYAAKNALALKNILSQQGESS